MTIENLGNLTLRINGPEIEEYGYLTFDLYNIPYDASVSFHFIAKVNTDLTSQLLENKSPYKIIIHNTGEDISTRNVDSFDVDVPEDGYYEVTTLVVPTVDYIENVLGFTPGSKVTSDVNTSIIAVDVKDNTVCFKILTYTQDEGENYYEHIWVGWEDISLVEVLTLLEESNSSRDTSIHKYTQSTFVYDNLFKCYINKASDLLNIYAGDSGLCSGSSLCGDSLNKYKSEIQIRDYLWMAINVIKYCIQNCQYLKALKILNCVSTCSGICSGSKITKSKVKTLGGCGCNKRN